jgi:hypothetical protein
VANFQVQLVSGSKTWINAELQSVGGAGRRAPRLTLNFLMRTTTERISSQLHHVRVRVFSGDELIGEGAVVGGDASWHGSPCLVEVPVTHRMIEWVTDSLPPNGDASLKLKWSGILRVMWRPAEGDPIMTSDPVAGEWTFVNIVENEMFIGVPRSDWFGKVLQPMGDDQYVYLEVPVPKGAAQGDWNKALALVEEADKAYAIGDDAGVFAKLRGALDALPGAKQNIVHDLPEPRRSAVDSLLRDVGEFLHHGRHVATEGEEAGSFPVNRIDASAALSMVRVMLSYVSQAITAAKSAES